MVRPKKKNINPKDNSQPDKKEPRLAGIIPRAVNIRPLRQTFLIVCEGAKTEPQYFEGFRLATTEVLIIGAGKNVTGLVAEAIRLRKSLKREEGGFRDQYWCVFDRDSFPAQSFNNAIQNANRAGFKVAYSNEAFEIWYLLHFDYHDAALSRKQYSAKLETCLERPYRKNDPSLYDTLLPRQNAAIRNARYLISQYSPLNPQHDNPSTTVYELVEKLNEQLPGIEPITEPTSILGGH